MAIPNLEPGVYWVRCVFTNIDGETDVYLTEHTISETWNYLECKRYILDIIINHFYGKDPKEVTFKRIKE